MPGSGDMKLIKPYIGASVGAAYTEVSGLGPTYYYDTPELQRSEGGTRWAAHAGALIRTTPRSRKTFAFTVDGEIMKLTGVKYGMTAITPRLGLWYEWTNGLAGFRGGKSFDLDKNTDILNFRFDYGYKLSRDTTLMMGAGFFPREGFVSITESGYDCDIPTYTCVPVDTVSSKRVDVPTWTIDVGVTHYFSL